MAKTPLFRHLARAFSILRRARAAAVPPLEWLDREREAHERRTLPRRTLLGAAASTALLSALPGCGSDPIEQPGAGAVVIVGAGLAGLHCAHRLARRGVLATVYDAAKRPGGRLFTDRTTFPEGQHCELGGELIDTDQQTMLDLAEELSIDLLDYRDDDPDLARAVAHIAGTNLTMPDIVTGFEPIAEKMEEALATLTDQKDLFVYYDKPNGGEALDAMSITTWLDSIGATGPVRTLLEVAYNVEYGLETTESNLLNLLFLISTETEPTAIQLFGASDERFHAKAGNDAYITALAARLDPAQIELEARLTALTEKSDGTYMLTFARGASTFEVAADHVVLAIPFTTLRKITTNVRFPEPKARAIAELGYGSNAKLMVGFSSRPWRTLHKSNGETFSDLGYQSTWETSRLQPGASGILTNFTGGLPGIKAGNGTPADQMATFLAQLEEVFPGTQPTANGLVARMHWPTSPLTLGSYSAYKVGQYTRFAGAEIERHRNLHFAGEHTSLDAQGYLEGAALTGAMAAEEIAADLDLPEQAPQSMSPTGIVLTTPADRIATRARLARSHRRYKTAMRRMGHYHGR